jgi:hypothetical protein
MPTDMLVIFLLLWFFQSVTPVDAEPRASARNDPALCSTATEPGDTDDQCGGSQRAAVRGLIRYSRRTNTIVGTRSAPLCIRYGCPSVNIPCFRYALSISA